MTVDKRLEILLNRAGQTISDLPKSDGKHLTYEREARSLAEREAFAFATQQDAYVAIIDYLAMHQDYILHLTDIIDRMETALENVCGERDYLIKTYATCADCRHIKECHKKTIAEMNEYCRENEEAFELNIPDDWSADDD